MKFFHFLLNSSSALFIFESNLPKGINFIT